ncbi:MAG: PspA/IM30 family protein [Candidatus Poribacteria bacterium]
MGIMDRIKLNLRANLNHLLDQVEDPQKLVDQLLLDMREGIIEFKNSIVDAIAGAKRLEREITENNEKVKLWEERAILALKHGDEELAKQALNKKLACIENERRAKIELEQQKKTIEDLKASLPILEVKLDELYKKKHELIRKSLEIQRINQIKRSQDFVSEIGFDTTVFNTYDSMVEKIKALEDHALALAELEKDDLEDEFKKLERKSQIEAELKSAKENIKTGE